MPGGDRTSLPEFVAESAFRSPFPLLEGPMLPDGGPSCDPNPMADNLSLPSSPFSPRFNGGNSSGPPDCPCCDAACALPWLPNRKPPCVEANRDDGGLNISSCPTCDDKGVPWFLCTGAVIFRFPVFEALDHIDPWLELGICALFDNEGNSL
jgi:hypothetical protein